MRDARLVIIDRGKRLIITRVGREAETTPDRFVSPFYSGFEFPDSRDGDGS